MMRVPDRMWRIACVILLVGTAATRGPAADRFWSDPDGGAFEASGNWEGSPPPGPADAAVFDLGASEYTVSFATSPTSSRLIVGDDAVELLLNGSTWTLLDGAQGIVVGQNDWDAGSLAVTDGTLAGGAMRIAASTGSDGRVFVAGPGSALQTTGGGMAIGSQGLGMLMVFDGGEVAAATTAAMGARDGAVGLVKVSDANSLWRVGGALTVAGAEGAEGDLRVENGGRVEVGGDAFLAAGGGFGQVSAVGTGSTLDCAGDLNVGGFGAALLDVLDGGLVAAGSARLGSEADPCSYGDAWISGPGSRLELGGALAVGGSGVGVVTVDAGATVAAGSAVIGQFAGAAGAVDVIGWGTLLDVAGELTVGGEGLGDLNVFDGGYAGCGSLYVGRYAGGDGNAVISGPDSVLEVGGDAEIGGPASLGVVTAADEGLLFLGDRLTVRTNGWLVLEGGIASARDVVLDGGIVQGNGLLDANLSGTAAILADGGTLTVGNGRPGAVNLPGPGAVEVTSDATLEVLSGDTAEIGDTVLLDNGVLVVRNGAELGPGGLIDGYGVVIGKLTAGGVPAEIAVPTGAVDLWTVLDVGADHAVVYSDGPAAWLGPETLLAGGQITSVQPLVLGPGEAVLRGWGTVDADVWLDSGVIDAEGDGIVLDGPGGRWLDGHGVVIGPVWAQEMRIADPTDTVVLHGELHVGGRQAEVYSVGPAELGPLTTLDGGGIASPSGLVVPDGAAVVGWGAVEAALVGEPGSLVAATGELEIGDWTAENGVWMQGTLEVGPHPVTLASFGPALLDGLTTLDGGELAAFNRIQMGDGSQLRGAGTVDGSVELQNGLIQAAAGREIEITQTLSGYGIIVGEVLARDWPIAQFPTGTVTVGPDAPFDLDVGAQTADVFSYGRALIEKPIFLAGGRLRAPDGIECTSEIYGFGWIDAAVSGQAIITADGGSLTLGDGSRFDGVEVIGGAVAVRESALELLDADEAVLDVDEVELDHGVLIVRNGLWLGSGTLLWGAGAIVGDVSGGLQAIHNPTYALTLEVPFDVSSESAAVFSAGEARLLGDVQFGGGVLRSAQRLRFVSSSLAGRGTVEADVALEGGTIAADKGGSIEIDGEVSGYGVVMGDVLAGGWPIAEPSGTADIEDDLDVGARSATIYSDGPSEVDGVIFLAGGTVDAPAGLVLGLGGGVEGHGAVRGMVYGEVGSQIVADGGDLEIGEDVPLGFQTDGVIDAGDRTVRIRSGSTANLGMLTSLAGGRLAAPSGVALRSGDGLVGFGTVDGPLAAQAGSTLVAEGPLTLGDANALDGFRSDGLMLVGPYTVTLRDRNAAVLPALTELGEDGEGGTLTAPNGMLLEKGKDLTGHGEVFGDFENRGTALGEGPGLTFHDTVTGPGGFDGNVTFAGTYSPGSSPAVVSFGGSAAFADTAVLAIEVAGNDNSNPYLPSYDALAVAGDVRLGGLLSLDWLAAAGDANSRFGGAYDVIVYAGDLDGTFAGFGGEIAAYFDEIDYAHDLGDGRHAVRVLLHELLAGDADLDGMVGAGDLAALAAGFGGTEGGWRGGDFNADGGSDHLDYLLWKTNLGVAVPGAAPEPGPVVLLALGASALLFRRRRAATSRRSPPAA